jgi:hypothetical protein
MYDFILALDPSGSFHEGKGTTGWVLMNKFGRVQDRGFITALNFMEPEAFWHAHNILISTMWQHYEKQMIVVVEDYLLYRDKAQEQTNSRMETCRLLGVIQCHCWEENIPYVFQRAVDVKTRWSYEILQKEKIIESHGTFFTLIDSGQRINRHELDALRHAMHFWTYKNKPAEDQPKKNNRLKSFYSYQDKPWEGRKNDDNGNGL